MGGALTALTGRGIRIAVVDSGVHASHPHVGRVAGGLAIDVSGNRGPDYVDRLGHGTAVAAAILEKAPAADLIAVKVFERSLATSVAALVAAIDWAIGADVHLINLSLGTPKTAHASPLREAVARAAARDVIVVSARRDDRQPDVAWFPGSLPGVLAVDVDWMIPRDRYRIDEHEGAVTMWSSGFPRTIPGVPPERNVHGVSFAVANATGFAARALEMIAPGRSLEGLLSALRQHAAALAP